MADDFEKRIRRYGRRDRWGSISKVKAVDPTRDNASAFVGGGFSPDRMHHTHPGVVLVRRVRGPASDPGWSRWQAGRLHLDGIHWEAKLWPSSDFVTFRDHVARLVEIKPSKLEVLEWRHTRAMTLIEDTRQEQAPLDPASKEYADLEWLIGAFTDVAEEFQEDIKALKATPAELVTAAR